MRYTKRAIHATQHSRQRSEVPLLRPVLLAIIEDELLAREHAPKYVSKYECWVLIDRGVSSSPVHGTLVLGVGGQHRGIV